MSRAAGFVLYVALVAILFLSVAGFLGVDLT